MVDRYGSERRGHYRSWRSSSPWRLGPLLGAGLSGLSAQALGYAPHLVLCALVSLSAAALALRALTPGEEPPHENPS